MFRRIWRADEGFTIIELAPWVAGLGVLSGLVVLLAHVL